MRYQLFAEMRQLLLEHPSACNPPDLASLPAVRRLMEAAAAAEAATAIPDTDIKGVGTTNQQQQGYRQLAPAGPAGAASTSTAAGSGPAAAMAAAEAAAAAVPDLEAQAGRCVAAWLGCVDSSYSGVRDVFGSMEEGLALWEAMGLWSRLAGGKGRWAGSHGGTNTIARLKCFLTCCSRLHLAAPR